MSNIRKLKDYEGNIVYPEISEDQIAHKANKDSIPTRLGQLENDTKYITQEDVPEVDLEYLESAIADLEENKADIEYTQNAIDDIYAMIEAIDIPEDVDLRPVLARIQAVEDSLDTKVAKDDIHAVATTGQYADLKGKPHIPSKIGELDNDIGMVSQVDMNNALEGKQDALGYTPENKKNKGQSDGYTPLDGKGKVPLKYLPDAAKQETYVVETYEDMQNLENLIIGEKCFIIKSSDTYIWDGNEWRVLSKAEWGSVVLDWDSIKDKPSSTQDEIDDSVSVAHTHTNMQQLNKISQRTFDDIQKANWHLLDGQAHLDDSDKEAIASISDKVDADSVYSKQEIDVALSSKGDARDVEQALLLAEQVGADVSKRLGSHVPRQTGIDYNDFKETGFYFIEPLQENCPPDLDLSSIYLTVVASKSNVYQRAVSYNAGKIAKRQYRNGKWDDWGYDLALTDENIEQVLGYSPISVGDMESELKGKADKTHSHTVDDITETNDKQFISQDLKAQIAGIPTKVGQLENDVGYITKDEVGGSEYVIPRIVKDGDNKLDELYITSTFRPAFEVKVNRISDEVTQDGRQFIIKDLDGYANIELEIESGGGEFALIFSDTQGYYSFTVYKTNGDREDSGWINDDMTHSFDLAEGDRIHISTGADLVVEYAEPDTVEDKVLMLNGEPVDTLYDDTDIWKKANDLSARMDYKADRDYVDEQLESIQGGGVNIITSKEEPEDIKAGDQWHVIL